MASPAWERAWRTGVSDATSFVADKIITGSFQGFLRIYNPGQSGYRIDDLILEQQLEAPILQIEAGRFVAYALPCSLLTCARDVHPTSSSLCQELAAPVAGGAASAQARCVQRQLGGAFRSCLRCMQLHRIALM